MKSLFQRATALALCTAPVGPLCLPSVASAQTAVEPAELTAAKWREDLRFMAAEMERRHANLYHHVSREQFRQAVDQLDARIPELQRNQIVVEMMRLAALVGDGHTRVEPRKDAAFRFRSLPLRLYLFDDGLFVRAAAPEHGNLLGARIDAIGGVPVAEAMRRAGELASGENQIGPKLYIPIYLGMPDVLQALQLSDSREAAELTVTRDGRTWTTRVVAGEVAALWPADTDGSFITPDGWLDARSTPQEPLWLADPLDYLKLVELPEHQAIYARVTWVTDAEDEPLDRFAERIFERARALNPRAMIFDVRLSQGGNGSLRQRLVNRLIRIEDEDTRLFVLTGRGSFSATQFILSDLDRLSEAVFIGEPASSSPSGYGDAYRSVMPNSGITVRSSIKYWQDGQDFRPWTPVDHAAPFTFGAYQAGRDPALETALGYSAPPSVSERILAAATTGGDPRPLASAWLADPINAYADGEQTFVNATLALASADETDAALSLAEWTTERFPRSIDAASVLASLLEGAGRTEEAIAAGVATLRLDPNHRFARSLLERLGSGTLAR
jgi:hypothetical protein